MVFFDNKIITLNSAYGSKQNGTMSSFVQFNFQGLLKEENSIIRSYISVVNAQFPASFYTINNVNNSFVLVLPDLFNSPFTISIPTGNYNATSLISALIPAFASLSIPFTMSITINKLTGRLTLNHYMVLCLIFNLLLRT